MEDGKVNAGPKNQKEVITNQMVNYGKTPIEDNSDHRNSSSATGKCSKHISTHLDKSISIGKFGDQLQANASDHSVSQLTPTMQQHEVLNKEQVQACNTQAIKQPPPLKVSTNFDTYSPPKPKDDQPNVNVNANEKTNPPLTSKFKQNQIPDPSPYCCAVFSYQAEG